MPTRLPLVPWIAALALVAAGCAGIDPAVLEVLTAPGTTPGLDPAAEEAYDLGYERGRSDDARRRQPDYSRYEHEYSPRTERAYATGYRDGYEGRAHRYGGYDEGGGGYDDWGVASGVPAWLVGSYRGWNERYDVDVELTFRSDGQVLLVSQGRQQRGVYRDGRVQLQRGTYRVERTGAGIRFTSEDDPGNTVMLRRSG